MSDSVVVEGQFAPPTMARSDAPIRIVGPGSVALDGDVLRVRGLKEKPMVLLTAALYLTVLLAAFGAIAGFVCMRDGEQDNVLRADYETTHRAGNRAVGYVVFAVAAAVGVGGSTLLRKAKRKASLKAAQTVELAIPLPSVKALTWEGDVAVFRIKKFKPSGGLYFVPNDRAHIEPLVAALQARGVKVASVPSLGQQFLGG